MSLAIQFQLKKVGIGGKQGGVVSDKKDDTHSCSIFFVKLILGRFGYEEKNFDLHISRYDF